MLSFFDNNFGIPAIINLMQTILEQKIPFLIFNMVNHYQISPLYSEIVIVKEEKVLTNLHE